jgi:hypothetical protein
MRRILIALLAVLLTAAPAAVYAQSAPAQVALAPLPAGIEFIPVAATEAPVAKSDFYLPVVALGAVAGVVGFNLLALGTAAIPGGLAYAAGTIVPAEMSVAMSRVYAGGSAVLGGWIGHNVYQSATTPAQVAANRTEWSIDPDLLFAGAGAITAIAAFNVLTGPLGTVPFAGAILAPVPYETALGSRLIAALSGGGGALAASFGYDAVTGESHDQMHLVTLGLGALGGVAVGNYLTGTLGTLPYYPGAGVSAASIGGAGMASAAAQAASRVYVIASAVVGAWAADWLYPNGK